MIVVILLALFPNAAIVYYGFIGLWVFILFVVGDMIITSIRVKRAAAQKWGERREKGLGWYSAMRTVQMRFMRLPKPQVRRGGYPA
jgi:phosphatidylglycerophosphate synthase